MRFSMEGDDELEGGAVVDDLTGNVILALISCEQDCGARIIDDIGSLVLAAGGIDGNRNSAVVERGEVGDENLGAVLCEQAHTALLLHTVDKQGASGTLDLFGETVPRQGGPHLGFIVAETQCLPLAILGSLLGYEFDKSIHRPICFDFESWV